MFSELPAQFGRRDPVSYDRGAIAIILHELEREKDMGRHQAE